MSLPSWASSLKEALRRTAEERPLRLAVLGIGHELRGDDAAGLAVARGLQGFSTANTVVIEAKHAPENHTGTLRRFKPTFVLLIDAAQMDEPPATIRWLRVADTTGVTASTHTLPPTMLARFLHADLGCDVALIGIQPADTTIGAPLSAGVETAVATLTRFLLTLCQQE